MASFQVKVTAKSGLFVRKEPNELSAKVTINPYATVLTASESKVVKGVVWYKVNGGWSSGKYLEVLNKSSTSATSKTTTTAANQQSKSTQNYQNTIAATQGSINNNTSSSKTVMSGATIPLFRMVHGLPFQFNPITDRRAVKNNTKDGYGWMYAKEYLATTPIVSFIPGSPSFLSSWSIGTKDKDKVIAALATGVTETLDSVQQGLSKNVQYYTHKSDWDSYYEYVNTCCRVSATLMGIGDMKIDGIALKNYDWRVFNNNTDKAYKSNISDIIRGLTGVDAAVMFAYEPNSSISNNLGNSTTESALSGAMKSASAKAREAEFLLGAGAGIEFESSSDEYIEQMIPKMSDVSKYNPNNPLSRVLRHGKNVMTGANLLFPEIWNDSSYVKDYSIDIKLESPYANKLSKYLYVLVPFWHLFCLAGPRTQDVNAYQAPFLIKAYSKGYFDVQLGMIDSISFKKYGDGESMGDDMLPMSLEVTLSFKDLYQALSMTSVKRAVLFYNNTGFMDMLGTMSGVSMNRESMLDRLALFGEQSAINMVRDIKGRAQEYVLDAFGIRDISRAIMGLEVR